MIRSYGSVYALGHKALQGLFDGPVVVSEKTDGSQFSMLVDSYGRLHCRSSGVALDLEAPDPLFVTAVGVARSLQDQLMRGWTYRCEYLLKPKHHTAAYARVPKQHLLLFDVDHGVEDYAIPGMLVSEAARLGLEHSPVLASGGLPEDTDFAAMLPAEACLGGPEPEGLVVKNYARFGKDKKILKGKYVTERFRENHKVEWKTQTTPKRADLVDELVAEYSTEARWRKAVQHLREAGELTGTPRDIGMLLREVPKDVLKECREEIAQRLLDRYWPTVGRGITRGLPEWYKQQLEEG